MVTNLGDQQRVGRKLRRHAGGLADGLDRKTDRRAVPLSRSAPRWPPRPVSIYFHRFRHRRGRRIAPGSTVVVGAAVAIISFGQASRY